MVNQSKKTQVESLVSSLQKSNNFLLIKIDRTSHQNLEALRRELRKASASVKVIKNAYFEKAINKMAAVNKSYRDIKTKFFPMRETSMMIMLDRSWDTGLKVFYEFAQKEKTLSFKLSYLDNTLYDQAGTTKIAKLPGRDQLIAKIIGSMKAPMSKFVYGIKFNTNKLVYILQTKSKEVKS